MSLFSQYYGQTKRRNYSLIVVLSHSVDTFSQFPTLNVHTHTHTPHTWPDNKVRELTLEGLFIVNLYQLDRQSTKFTIWKY